ncbi:MAG: hypothetical protein SF069_01915 [Phycisphaerae bacterium]|nr:hypothetical protein [Phycisphaerae bacterium]
MIRVFTAIERVRTAVSMWRVKSALLLALVAPALAADLSPKRFDDPAAWKIAAADGVFAEAAPAEPREPGPKPLRINIEFRTGGGFCTATLPVNLSAAENYRFVFAVRGALPPNNLEFKLIDTDGESVWWLNRRDFEFSETWQNLSQSRRDFEFAWGPSRGAPLKGIKAIEFAIASSEGGKGWVEIGGVDFAPLPPIEANPKPAKATDSKNATPRDLPADGRVDWTPTADDKDAFLDLTYDAPLEIAAIIVERDLAAGPLSIVISGEIDHGQGNFPVASVREMTARRAILDGAPIATRKLRITRPSSTGGLTRVLVLRSDDIRSRNALMQRVAKLAQPGEYPRYYRDEQQFWTVVGLPADSREALIDEGGAIESQRKGPRIEPFLWLADESKLLTWADVTCESSLAEGHLPLPSVHWRHAKVGLQIETLAAGEIGDSVIAARYRVTNPTSSELNGALALAIRPFQVQPPAQFLNLPGGVCKVESLACSGGELNINDRLWLRTKNTPAHTGVSTLAQGEIIEHLALGKIPEPTTAKDESRLASAALWYPLKLAPGGSTDIVIHLPDPTRREPSQAINKLDADFDTLRAKSLAAWKERLGGVALLLPKSQQPLVDTFYSQQAYILVNADGPAIQPGSRTYERSWIRDGALTCVSLLRTGHADAVRDFIDWYAPRQFENGKVPCVLDRRGPDPVPEHDSTGQLIYLLRKYYQYTGDRDTLARHYDHVLRGVAYLDELRRQRMTPEYRDAADPLKRACYGLVTESISHEGYSDKPRHSYWDGFFVLRGLRDATAIATTLNKPDDARRFQAFYDEYRVAMRTSIELVMQTKSIDYIPGCAELGDFDATSTAIGLYPCDEISLLPRAAWQATFDRYWTFFNDRAGGKLTWDRYTPYETRIIAAYNRLDQPERAHALLGYFLGHRFPAGWNHWAEVVHNPSRKHEFIGDMPHTWVGSGYLNAVCELFAYVDEGSERLMLASGVADDWWNAGQPVGIRKLNTELGQISYEGRKVGNVLTVQLACDATPPPGGAFWRLPPGARGATLDGTPCQPTDAGWVRLPALKGELRIE